MCCKGFFKRIVPFFLTFAVGLFIASFFVSITAPNFQFRRNFREHRQADLEREARIQQLSEENSRLKKELSEKDRQYNLDYAFDEYNDFVVPPPPPMPPAPSVRVKAAPYPVTPYKTKLK